MNPIKKLLTWYFSKNALPYWCLLILDCGTVLISGIVTYWLFNKTQVMFEHRQEVVTSLLLYALLSLVGARAFRTYSGIVRYSSFVDLLNVAYANIVSLVLCIGASLLFKRLGVSSLSAITAAETVAKTLSTYGGKVPIVIDADATFHVANMLKDENFRLPEGCILTPHVGELARLTGERSTHRERIVAASELATKQNCVVVLKGAYTVTLLPDGRRIFNVGGNSGMATAGSGDVLTGIIGALLAQGYEPAQAAILGVILHSTSGDLAAKELGEEALLARDIINNIGKAYREIKC